MKLPKGLKKFYNLIFDIPSIPDYLKDIREPMILHISDTPVSYHDFIYKMIEELKPTYLIHTGDLVDNIKLEFNPQLKDAYKVRAVEFIHRLEDLDLKEIYLVPGNHDDLEIIKNNSKKIKIVGEGINLEFKNIIINVAHHPWELKKGAKYYLFGHNLEEIPRVENKIYLNGLNKMNIILLDSDHTIAIDYPYGINQDRKMYKRPKL